VLIGCEGESASIESATQAIRARPPEQPIFLQLDPSFLPPNLCRLAGSDGWWFAYRFEVGGLRPEEKLIHLVLIAEGDRFRALSPAESESFVKLPAREEPLRRPASTSVADAHALALSMAREEITRSAEQRSFAEADLAREQIDRYAEDCLFEARQSLEEARVRWESARTELGSEMDPFRRLKARAQVQKLERDYRRELSALRAAEETRYAEKDRALEQLTDSARVTEQRALVASAYFWFNPAFAAEPSRLRRP
jgi:hypothetical protein